ncbi:MAG: ABC transporter ATP-binding protein [Gammaproteobacteria bacterium]
MIQIRADRLSKRVETPTILTILDQITLSVPASESLAILGPSGSGKTTLLSLLAGLDKPTEGNIFWDNTNICRLTEAQRTTLRLGNVGFVFQNFQLLPHLTALENVEIALELCDQDSEDAARAMLAKVGLEKRLKHYPRQLSGGEQQRVALARAYVMRPKVLFADEPTGNLDWQTAQIIKNLLAELNQIYKTTLIIATHAKVLADICHQVLELQLGRLES